MKFALKSYTKVRSDLDAFFINLEEKIALYEQHIETTIRFYGEEREKNLKPIKAQFEKDSAETDEHYNKIYNEWEGSEDEKRLMALHLSNYDDMIGHYEVAEDMVNEHYAEMFDYFNKSSTVILYALLESELKRLCGILKTISGSRIAVEDFEDRDYIKGSFRYLDLVIEIPIAPLEPFETKIKHIQYVRNRIVHNAGEFSKKEDVTLTQVIEQSEALLKLIDDYESDKRYLKIWDPAYIAKGYQLIRELFRTIFWAIEEKFGHLVLKERIKRLFKADFGATEIAIIDIAKIKKGTKVAFSVKVLPNEADAVWDFNCTITVTESKSYAIEIVNQIEGNEKIKNCVAELERKSHRLFYSFAYTIFETNPSVQIKIMFS
jgi:hypothetical protein